MEHLFVSNIGGENVGVARVVEDRPGEARIVLFRVASEWCHTSVPKRLLRDIHEFCQERDCRTLSLEPGATPPWMSLVLERCGFRVLRRKESSGRKALEFRVETAEQPSATPSKSRKNLRPAKVLTTAG